MIKSCRLGVLARKYACQGHLTTSFLTLLIQKTQIFYSEDIQGARGAKSVFRLYRRSAGTV